MKHIHIIDSHTGGEPTRTVIDGGPDLGGGPVRARLERLRAQHDDLRRQVILEPRGSDILVGALLLPPEDPACAAGVIFFNNVGYLGMCGHGTIGIVHTLAYLGRIGPGAHRIETPVGTVTARLGSDGRVAVDNVASARIAAQVALDVPGYGRMRGDVAWGGNWFFLVDQGEHKQTLDIKNAGALTACADQIRTALTQAGIRGAGGAEIDHIELFGPPSQPGADSRSFVLCPGSAYDRSPCGTGTSAKLACLAADGKLAEGRVWRQESITGSVFEAAYARVDGEIRPTITGRAHITADARLIVDPKDPFRDGIAAR